MITTALSMLILVLFFAVIRGIVYVIQEKLEKNVPQPISEEEKKAVEEKYVRIRKKILLISAPAFILGAFAAKYFYENGYEFLSYPAGFISFVGCIGVIARGMVVPRPME